MSGPTHPDRKCLYILWVKRDGKLWKKIIKDVSCDLSYFQSKQSSVLVQKLIKLENWNKYQRHCTLLMSNLVKRSGCEFCSIGSKVKQIVIVLTIWIQNICKSVMLTRSLERIFNSMCNIGLFFCRVKYMICALCSILKRSLKIIVFSYCFTIPSHNILL